MCEFESTRTIMDRNEKLGKTRVFGVSCARGVQWSGAMMDDQAGRKRYAVVISKSGASELGAFLSHLMSKTEGVSYFKCKKIDPSGPYFHMVVEHPMPNDSGDVLDFEIQIPHSFIVAVTYTADLKRIGFLRG
jgi:hypothetical protein